MSSNQNSNNLYTDKGMNSVSVQDINEPNQSNKNINPQVVNPFTDIKPIRDKRDLKENKSQTTPNTTDKNYFQDKNLYDVNKNGVIKIKLFKSTIKPYKQKNLEESEQSSNLTLLKQKPMLNKDQINNTPTNTNQTNDNFAQYKTLIKKIAKQLKNKIRPRTKGFFYMKIIRNEKYINIVKKIAKSIKNKLGLHPPTNGVFFSYMKNEEEIRKKKEKKEQYKLLIKKLASQLKKRIKFPTSKILKIYESYRILIKRIAQVLKKSMKTKEENIEKNNNNIIKNNIFGEVNNQCENSLDIDTPIHVKNDNDNSNIKEKEVQTFENNKMDIELNDYIGCPPENNETATEITKRLNENNDLKTIIYEQKLCNITSEKKLEDNQISNYTFSKMEVIDNEFPKSSENKRPSQVSKNSIENTVINLNKNEIPKINSDELIYSDKREELIYETKDKIVEEKVINNIEIANNSKLKNYKIHKNIIRSGKSMPSSTKEKKLFGFSLIKKEDLFNLENERKIFNKSHSKNNVNFNMENLNEIYKNISNMENKGNKENNLSLKEIEITKSNFLKQFEKFLEQENIEIINNMPVSTNDKSILLFQQSNFWYLIMTYLFYKNNNLSIYNVIFLLEQYFVWSKDKKLDMFISLKERIKDYINSHNSKKEIDQFLFMNKLKNLEQIFEKFELPIVYESKKPFNEFKETKVEEMCFCCENNGKNCKCDLCVNDDACIQKVYNINKSRIEVVNNSCMNIIKKEFSKEDLIKRNNEKVMFHNNEELFYKGSSKINENISFSKSKTILDNRGNFQYIYNPPTSDKKEDKVIIVEKNANNFQIEDNDIMIDGKKDLNSICEIKNKEQYSCLESSSKKNFKNISKSEKKVEEEEDLGKVVIEGIGIKKGKEEIESSEDEIKTLQKEKKSRKGKSRKKNNKKKKETIKSKDLNDADCQEDTKNVDEKENKAKSVIKKRKSTNRNSFYKNKENNCDKNEENEEKKEKSDSCGILSGSKSVHKFEEDNSAINYSKKKKSKTPNKKKSKKH